MIRKGTTENCHRRAQNMDGEKDWMHFERSGSIIDYLNYREKVEQEARKARDYEGERFYHTDRYDYTEHRDR